MIKEEGKEGILTRGAPLVAIDDDQKRRKSKGKKMRKLWRKCEKREDSEEERRSEGLLINAITVS